MKKLVSLAVVILAVGSIAAHPARSRKATSPFINVIEGTIYDQSRTPVPNLWVELQNEINQTYARMRTSQAGRYQFTGMRAGSYVVKVYTTGTEFQEASESVELINLVASASDGVNLDITLKPKKERAPVITSSEAVFVQDVPPEAVRLYKAGKKDMLNKEVAKGRDEMVQAIKLYPQYFSALNDLGCSYVETKEYFKSLPYLLESINVNQRSFSSYYSLGYAAFKLDQIPDAVTAAHAAVTLNGSSVNAQLLYGTTLRLSEKYDDALTALSKAEKLSKNAPIAEVHWQLALTLNRLKRNDEAVKHIETYLNLAPNAANRTQAQELIKILKSQPKPQTFAVN